jgi:RimJ/RimL family protein N-acetyltransferase
MVNGDPEPERRSHWQGDLVKLRAVEPADWEIYHAWNFDDEMMGNLWYLPLPQSREAGRRWAEHAAVAQPDGDNFRFAIESLATGQVVGDLTTHHCDPRFGTFSFGIAIDPQARRRGYAAEAIRLVLHHYFTALRYQKAYVGVYSFNDASRGLFARLGFAQEGRQRRMIYARGQYHDIVNFGMTDDEFAERSGSGDRPGTDSSPQTQ